MDTDFLFICVNPCSSVSQKICQPISANGQISQIILPPFCRSLFVDSLPVECCCENLAVFTAENAEFAEACEAEGLVFIGPPAAAIRAMGNKVVARRMMEEAKRLDHLPVSD